MLTEIEWWGGLIFVFGGLSYWFNLREAYPNTALAKFFMHASFLFPAVVLALYFYELTGPAIMYAYLACVAGSIVAFSAMLFWAESESEAAEIEEEGVIGLIFASIILYSPIGIACFLGLLKSYHIFQSIGWVS